MEFIYYSTCWSVHIQPNNTQLESHNFSYFMSIASATPRVLLFHPIYYQTRYWAAKPDFKCKNVHKLTHWKLKFSFGSSFLPNSFLPRFYQRKKSALEWPMSAFNAISKFSDAVLIASPSFVLTSWRNCGKGAWLEAASNVEERHIKAKVKSCLHLPVPTCLPGWALETFFFWLADSPLMYGKAARNVQMGNEKLNKLFRPARKIGRSITTFTDNGEVASVSMFFFFFGIYSRSFSFLSAWPSSRRCKCNNFVWFIRPGTEIPGCGAVI